MTTAKRPEKIRKYHSGGCLDCGINENIVWNRCCDQWEAYLKDAGELLPLDREELLQKLGSIYCNPNNSGKKLDSTLIIDIAEMIIKNFGQPRANVPSVEELKKEIYDYFEEQRVKHEKAILKGSWGLNGGWSTETNDVVCDLSTRIHALLTQRLGGKYELA